MYYFIPAELTIFEEEIKKSRFITYLQHTQGLNEAKTFVAEIKKIHPHARHHCWASVSLSPHQAQGYGFSDDGEPSGTAGKPMLACLQGSGMGEITAVVVRYFGGTLLGTGGLVRAYSNGVNQALKQMKTLTKIPRKTFHLTADYPHIPLVQHLCQSYNIIIENQTFHQRVDFTLAISSDTLLPFCNALKEQSSGVLVLTEIINQE